MNDKIQQALALFETDPQTGYQAEAAILREEFIRLNKLNQELATELLWAWNNLAKEYQGTDVFGEVVDSDTCAVCMRPTYKHKSTCELKHREELAHKLTKGLGK